MVNTSPRLRDSLDYEDPEETDPRLFFGLGTLSINSAEYEDYEPDDDHRPIAGRPFPSATRRKGRQRRQGQALNDAPLFEYQTTADGDVFRVVTLLAGTGDAPIQCRLDSRKPRKGYRCLSYCWGATTDRNVAILLNGFRFAVTENLHNALQCIRKANTEVRIWVDQICINQSDYDERAHQVSIMKHIFSKAKVVVWLGEEDDRSRKLCEFTRVWVIPEVALASYTEVAIGNDLISWDNLVRLIKDTQLPQNGGFDKQTALLGNPRQRIAILSQMAASQREGLLHTDITQLLILAKSSDATDHRDKIYAFFGLTLLSLRPDYRELPDYKRSIERLYVEIAKDYVNNILYVDYYSKWHSLSEQHRTQQLMSMLYSAGRLHQHFDLPSWVPDWTFAWYQAPFWCTTDANLANFSGKDDWSAGIRSQYRAGGEKLGTFELGVDAGRHCLRVSALIIDRVVEVSETTPASTPGFAGYSASLPAGSAVTLDSPTFSYGRGSFKTKSGLLGMATKGVQAGDALAIIVGGDVPVVLRAMDHLNWDRERDAYVLLCECFVQSHDVMDGELLSTDICRAEDIDIT
ncbi:hypothetical protein LTR91_025189 [Friedmanniomyces endolithicus]|uniref:Heterokaryon incompatibility domain-containing protein n=1 Tax=Friedmanniomyces endolithicus TaxID=329885 RepID=A0AAN6GZ89_9PEZI|nr:hypothetical protein LTR57_020942 [Friedmanniomyces endolithicus]KAK0951128.1 hypothetical protein LTR91_025189 [Friedmanniomyces endolithicus]KAK0951871.1 hypothetical protein LTS01_025065 [Friedmanniomyces endolithicus]KAK1023946.1 hypothetical protein LTS16_024476 [Friedmanniomyces endolithicus]